MKYHIGRLVILSSAFVLLSACNGTNATGTAGTGASPSPSPAAGSAGGDIYATKQSYLAFLECAGKKDSTAASMAGPLTSAVNVYTDEQWVNVKEVVKVTHKSFIDRYGAGCK